MFLPIIPSDFWVKCLSFFLHMIVLRAQSLKIMKGKQDKHLLSYTVLKPRIKKTRSFSHFPFFLRSLILDFLIIFSYKLGYVLKHTRKYKNDLCFNTEPKWRGSMIPKELRMLTNLCGCRTKAYLSNRSPRAQTNMS